MDNAHVMLTKHNIVRCRKCRTNLGYALTFTEVATAKGVLILQCENCGTPHHLTINTGNCVDVNQLDIFPPVVTS